LDYGVFSVMGRATHPALCGQLSVSGNGETEREDIIDLVTPWRVVDILKAIAAIPSVGL
jgi:hypothetical protein